MKDKQTTTKGFAILSLAGVINKFLALAYLPIQTMIVGNYGNGIISAGYRIYILIFALSNAGVPVALSKLISERTALGDSKGTQKIFRITAILLIILGVFFGSVMALGAGWISKQIAQANYYIRFFLSKTKSRFGFDANRFLGNGNHGNNLCSNRNLNRYWQSIYTPG